MFKPTKKKEATTQTKELAKLSDWIFFFMFWLELDLIAVYTSKPKLKTYIHTLDDMSSNE